MRLLIAEQLLDFVGHLLLDPGSDVFVGHMLQPGLVQVELDLVWELAAETNTHAALALQSDVYRLALEHLFIFVGVLVLLCVGVWNDLAEAEATHILNGFHGLQLLDHDFGSGVDEDLLSVMLVWELGFISREHLEVMCTEFVSHCHAQLNKGRFLDYRLLAKRLLSRERPLELFLDLVRILVIYVDLQRHLPPFHVYLADHRASFDEVDLPHRAFINAFFRPRRLQVYNLFVFSSHDGVTLVLDVLDLLASVVDPAFAIDLGYLLL